MNIRNRLSLQFAAIFAIILAVALISVYYITVINTRGEFYGRLEDRAYIAARFFLEKNRLNSERLSQFQNRYLQKLPDEEIQIYNDSLAAVYPKEIEHRYKEKFLKNMLSRPSVHTSLENKQMIGLQYKVNGRNYLVLVSAIDRYGQHKLKALRIAMFISYFISLIIIYVIGRFFARRALKPMEEVVNQVKKITVGKLNLRVSEGNGKDEIAELAVTFNKMLERLEHSFELQRTFISNASHELRTPLTIILGEIDVLLSKRRTEANYTAALESISRETEQLSTLVNTLLSMAQNDSDQFEFIENVRLDELIWEVIADIRKKNPDNKILFEMNELPADPDKMSIKGNHSLLFSSFTNLLENALKFSNGKVVRCRFNVKGDFIIIDIIDQGVGISPKDQKSLFQPFFRAPNARSLPGHGLGLALTNKIVRMHNGHIDVISKEGSGTTFRVMFTIIG